MTVPPEYGGAGADTVSWCVAQEELGRASAAVADVQLLCKLMCDMILVNGSEGQRRAYLPAMVRGEKICAIAQTYQIWEGTSQIQRLVIARQLLG